MDIFGTIAERKIVRAMKEGEFHNLPGAGKPLVLRDETWIPEDLRLAYRLLRNAGFIPPELELRNDILSLKRLLTTLDDDTLRLKKVRELNWKVMQLSMMKQYPLRSRLFPGYEDRVYRRLMPEEP